MNTEKESAFRFLSHREGSVQPMFDVAPIGPLSPSSSLLVERRDLEPTSWQSHFLEDLLFQILIDQMMTRMHQLLDWLNTMPWQVLLA